MHFTAYRANSHFPALFLDAPARARRRHRGPNCHLRLLFLVVVTAVACGVLAWRLWLVQVVDGDKYAARLAENSEVSVRIPPVRGEIRDRNGVLLVQNRSSLDIEFYLPEMVRAYRERYGDVPKINYVGRVRGMATLMPEPDIVQIVDTAVIPRLRMLGLPTSYDREDLVRHFRIDSEVPFTFVENADFATVSRFSEHDIGLPGVRIAMKPIRHYLYGALAAHVLGYVGEPQDIAMLSDVRDFEFYDPNVEGKAQIEHSMDAFLRGKAGTRFMQRNLKGAIDKELLTEPPRQGDTVYLTLDARIQFITEQALRAVGRAGAVVVDPNNGDILAMASVPSFDPNSFIPSIPADAWKRLLDDPADPLVNRAISAFPPGSTFKIFTALAGLREGLVNTPFTCSGGVSYGDHYFQCWSSRGHGRLTVSDAIKVSCNAFFYQYGNAAGIDAIDTVGTLLGLGQTADIGLTGEQPGILPGPEWLKLHSTSERWSLAQTANVSIGQGYDLVSPLQLVMAYSTIANGGTAYYPRLVAKVAAPGGSPSLEPLPDFAKPRVRGTLDSVGIGHDDVELLRAGFWRVVNEDGGTARRARLAGGIVAGKTGTAQAQLHGRNDTIAWFVCFAPFEAPRYAVCVTVQGGAHGGSVAAPIAAHILEQTLAMDDGLYHPTLVALAPARHRDPFRMIEALERSGGQRHADASADDEPGGRWVVVPGMQAGRREFAAPRLAKPHADSGARSNHEAQGKRASSGSRSGFKNLFDWFFRSRGGR